VPLLRSPLAVVLATLVAGTGIAGAAAPATADPAARYTVTIGSTGTYPYPTDTPASAFTDADGTFHFQQSAALYGADDPRYWEFYTGGNFDTATRDASLSDAVNPDNPQDANNDTTWRCNNSPTGQESTYAPAGSGYAQKNYCDLVGVWVDPDTGDWYGIVHNEFTPEPFGAYSFSHYDALDYAVSADHGKTWTIEGHAITSPYSTERGDTNAFPNQSFYYGDGDPRLFADPVSGYFYLYYGSRVVPKAGAGGSDVDLEHVARAPMSAKMATGSWQKWYDGQWSQPGVGGKESNIVPVDDDNPTGYTPPDKDYSPASTGNPTQQVAAGTLPPKSPLFVMNIVYDAYLGLYIGEPEHTNGLEPQRFYATADLNTQQWRLIGDSGSYTSESWYRWIVDSATLTGTTIVGKSFRSYCAIACNHSDGEYANVTIDTTAPAQAPVRAGQTYRIASGDGRVLATTGHGGATTSMPATANTDRTSWRFVATGDGAYQVLDTGGRALGVDATGDTGRAWGATPTVTAIGAGGPTTGQQWFIVPNRTEPGSYRLINRYSGLVLGMSATHRADTTPVRAWTDPASHRTAADQTLRFLPAY
jgi:hypothetical protein